MNTVAKAENPGEMMEAVIAKGDLSKLSAEERARYYVEVCRSLNLNPLTKPFEYIVLNNKLTLYAGRACTDQLRKINGISVEIASREIVDGLLIVHARAKDVTGRTDEDFGAVALPDTLKGEARANAILKAVTKAKRRATLSICGLGMLDETEIEDIPASAKRTPPPAASNVMLPPHDLVTGELEPVDALDRLKDRNAQIERDLRAATEKGSKVLQAEWGSLHPADQKHFMALKDRQLKPRALEVDAAMGATG